MKRTKQAMQERLHIICQIRDAIAEKDMNYDEFARQIGMTKDTVTKRLNGICDFKLTELIVIADLLGIEFII